MASVGSNHGVFARNGMLNANRNSFLAARQVTLFKSVSSESCLEARPEMDTYKTPDLLFLSWELVLYFLITRLGAKLTLYNLSAAISIRLYANQQRLLV